MTHPHKHLEFCGVRYPAGYQSRPLIMFVNIDDRTERHYFQATSVMNDWFGFFTYVDFNGKHSEKTEEIYYLAAVEETFIIDLTAPHYNCIPVEELRKWMMEQLENPVHGVILLNQST